MNIEDLIEQMICERIEMLMGIRPEEIRNKGMELCRRQESIVKDLDQKTRDNIDGFVDELAVQSGEDNRYLYLAGITDGIRIAKFALRI